MFSRRVGKLLLGVTELQAKLSHQPHPLVLRSRIVRLRFTFGIGLNSLRNEQVCTLDRT